LPKARFIITGLLTGKPSKTPTVNEARCAVRNIPHCWQACPLFLLHFFALQAISYSSRRRKPIKLITSAIFDKGMRYEELFCTDYGAAFRERELPWRIYRAVCSDS
jgi:hypothetical protein